VILENPSTSILVMLAKSTSFPAIALARIVPFARYMKAFMSSRIIWIVRQVPDQCTSPAAGQTGQLFRYTHAIRELLLNNAGSLLMIMCPLFRRQTELDFLARRKLGVLDILLRYAKREGIPRSDNRRNILNHGKYNYSCNPGLLDNKR